MQETTQAKINFEIRQQIKRENNINVYLVEYQ